jgi:hypothetical protein
MEMLTFAPSYCHSGAPLAWLLQWLGIKTDGLGWVHCRCILSDEKVAEKPCVLAAVQGSDTPAVVPILAPVQTMHTVNLENHGKAWKGRNGFKNKASLLSAQHPTRGFDALCMSPQHALAASHFLMQHHLEPVSLPPHDLAR